MGRLGFMKHHHCLILHRPDRVLLMEGLLGVQAKPATGSSGSASALSAPTGSGPPDGGLAGGVG